MFSHSACPLSTHCRALQSLLPPNQTNFFLQEQRQRHRLRQRPEDYAGTQRWLAKNLGTLLQMKTQMAIMILWRIKIRGSLLVVITGAKAGKERQQGPNMGK